MANTQFATQLAQSFVRAKFCSDWVEMFCKVPIGATGAVGTLVKDAPIDVTRDSTGTYSITYPKSADCEVRVGIMSAAGTVVTANPTACDGTAGTATFVTRNAAGSATDPASGDVLLIFVKSRVRL